MVFVEYVVYNFVSANMFIVSHCVIYRLFVCVVVYVYSFDSSLSPL